MDHSIPDTRSEDREPRSHAVGRAASPEGERAAVGSAAYKVLPPRPFQGSYWQDLAASASEKKKSEQASSLGLSSFHNSPKESEEDKKARYARLRADVAKQQKGKGKEGYRYSDPKGYAVAKVAKGGSFLQLKSGEGLKMSRSELAKKRLKICKPPQKKKISDFTKGSRRRLMTSLQCIDREKLAVELPLFLTLTYGATWPDDPKLWKRHLDNFGKWLRRHYPQCFAVWRLEYQKRGAPHFHLIVFNLGFMPHSELAAAWNKIVGGDAKHLKAGTEVRRVRHWNGVMSYAAKYVSKPQGALAEGVSIPKYAGRFWGIIGREAYAASISWDERKMTYGEFYIIRRIVAAYLRKKGVRVHLRPMMGISAFMAADLGIKLLDGLGVV